MKRSIALLLSLLLLAGCTAQNKPGQETVPAETVPVVGHTSQEISYTSRFGSVTQIDISDDGISVDGAGETDTVFISNDIIYYEDKEKYESGYPYGEGEEADRHTADEADAHTVVNITAPGAYRISGKMSAGQIRIDLGEAAYEDPNAVVELILSNADITCSVAPAVIFMNVYECDENWSVDTAKADVDTTAAGACLVLEGENSVTGSHVAKIFKDKEGEKKLWKQDGAIYSYMSMNVYGPGKLDLTADNEGLDTELHLTVNGGEIAIRSDNDGINTNEDGVSVTAINGGDLHIIAGLGAEGDGIDSNGYLVINGGTVVASANPGADAGMDADLGSYINGGFVIAMGSTMDWAESESSQVTMNLQFASNQSADSAVVVERQDGTVIFAYDPSADEVLSENKRVYSGAILSCANFYVGETYRVYVDGEVTGAEAGGVYDPTTVTAHEGGVQMAYTGTDVMMRPGGVGGMGFSGQTLENFDPENIPEGMERPEIMDRGDPPEMPDGQMPTMPENYEPGEKPEGTQMPENGRGDMGQIDQMADPGEANTAFYMQDKVNFFSGLTNA